MKSVAVRAADLDLRRTALAQDRVPLGHARRIRRSEHDGRDTRHAVRMFCRSAAWDAKLARRQVLDEERQWLLQARDAPGDTKPIGPRTSAFSWWLRDEVAEGRHVLTEIVRAKREVGPSAAALGHGRPDV